MFSHQSLQRYQVMGVQHVEYNLCVGTCVSVCVCARVESEYTKLQ